MKQFFLMAVILLGMTACNQQKKEIMEEKKEPVLGLGEPISDNFTGEVWLRMLSAQPEYDCSIYNVTFAPGTRNYWHTHSVGQILICTRQSFYTHRHHPESKRKQSGVVGRSDRRGIQPGNRWRHLLSFSLSEIYVNHQKTRI